VDGVRAVAPTHKPGPRSLPTGGGEPTAPRRPFSEEFTRPLQEECAPCDTSGAAAGGAQLSRSEKGKPAADLSALRPKDVVALGLGKTKDGAVVTSINALSPTLMASKLVKGCPDLLPP